MVNVEPQEVPKNLDWDMYCGPSPLRLTTRTATAAPIRLLGLRGRRPGRHGPAFPRRPQLDLGQDRHRPRRDRDLRPPRPPGMHRHVGWSELKYADGFTFVLVSGEWGKGYDRLRGRGVTLADLDDDSRRKVEAMPDPPPFNGFPEAIRKRTLAGGHAEAAFRTATLLHLTNVSIRVGRKIKFDPVNEVVIGDEEATGGQSADAVAVASVSDGHVRVGMIFEAPKGS